MSLEYINGYYGTNYKLGDNLKFDGKDVVIVGVRNQYLKVKYECGHTVFIHATWRVETNGDNYELYDDK